ncbi:hypothetical protein [Baekduia sp. Peel2402]|uniref:hypothetical protein n=1 Tax=Baekduia sp. Peel2402 TaxID=3458296 RepID=UPI00403EE572
MRHRLLVSAAAALSAAVLAPAVAMGADTVVPNNQIVQGFQCLGPTCADGEAMTGPLLWEKSNDTPGIRLAQGNGGGYTAQTWDVAGNEANFFIRDLTGGSKLPFRIRPGAPTSSIDIQTSGTVNTTGLVQQSVQSVAPTGAIDGDGVLAGVRGLSLNTYTTAGETHALPVAFNSAFGLGAASNQWLAPQDVATVALAAVKALDARVTAIALTPGPKGDTGTKGEAGSSGAAGAKGDAGAAATADLATLAAADRRIAALEKSNAKLSKSLATLQKQVAKLVKKTPTAKKARAARGGANGRR